MGLPRSHRELDAAGVYRGARVYTRAYFDIPRGGGLVFTVKATDLRGPSLSIGRFQSRLNPRLTPEDNNSWLEWRSQKGNSDESVMILRLDGPQPSRALCRANFFVCHGISSMIDIISNFECSSGSEFRAADR